MIMHSLQTIGIKPVHLVVHPKNVGALLLYLKCGFEMYGWDENYYGDGQPRLLVKRVLQALR
jgi:ribosomal protein S18 acetylase RimI-like enzyme